MTDPTPQTTHTRDEAPERIRVAQDADGFWTCREAISGSQEYVRADLASAPAPASGGVDAVARPSNELLDALDDLARRMPVGSDMLLISEAIGLIQSLSPAATPVSEAEPVAWRWRYEGEKSWSFRQTKPTDWPDVEMQPLYALAKRASSPAGELLEALSAEKPFIFDPGTGFAHADDGGAPAHGVRWAPQEEASPAGGYMVDEQALNAARKVYNETLESEWKCGATERVVRAYLAALSQSTSAGRG